MPRKRQDITGQVFGNITVLKDSGTENVLCQCALCGKQKMMNRYNISRSERIKANSGCGCQRHYSGLKNAQNLAAKKGLAGKIFPGVEVIEETGEKRGTQKIYRCRCLHCGKIFETRGVALTRGDTKSCGCKKIELATAQITADLIDGTKIGMLASKTPGNNTSGVKGVSQVKRTGYWTAYITFKGKRYSLYTGPDKEQAIRRRKEAEQRLFGDFLSWLKSESPAQWERINHKIAGESQE